MNGPTSTVVDLLELTATERPELLEFHVETLLNSVMGFAVHQLAADFGVPLEKVGLTLYQASQDVDRLVKRRGVWRNPAQVLESPNVSALLYLCRARAHRLHGTARQRRLDVILRKLERADELARSRAWIEDFIGPPVVRRQDAQSADR